MSPDNSFTSQKPVRNKWLLIGAAVLAGVLFLTNPDQATHLRSINDAVDLRFPKSRLWGSNEIITAAVVRR